MHPTLRVLDGEIASRVADITAAQPDFPCRKGCDHCCRHLAALPQLTAPEWDLLRSGIEQLPASTQADVRARLAALGPEPPRPVACPLLDSGTGACLVYTHRPIACRTYGFYTGRAHDAWCGLVADHVAQLDAPALLGNLDASEAALTRIGSCGPLPPDERRDLLDWLGL